MATRTPPSEVAAELFHHCPDYLLCRALAENILEGRLSRHEALRQLAARGQAMERNRGSIGEKLDGFRIPYKGDLVRVRGLSLGTIISLDDKSLASIVKFYFKHPYAHGRTLRSRWLPRRIRAFFLSVLLGHAKGRNLELNYEIYFEMLRIL